jgi:ABC-type sulfate transport system substrate-binding protein
MTAIDYRDTVAIIQEARKEDKHVKEVAKEYVKHFYNEKGEQLARIEDS